MKVGEQLPLRRVNELRGALSQGSRGCAKGCVASRFVPALE
jgi:hypothetical protein